MGSIKYNSDAKTIAKIRYNSDGKLIKKVYSGSTLIWENTPAVTYNYVWQPRFKNTSTSTNPAFVGSNGTLTIKDSNNNVLATKTVTIPTMNATVDTNISFQAGLLTSVTAEFSYGSYVFSTTTVGFSQPAGGVRNGSPISVSFSFD